MEIRYSPYSWQLGSPSGEWTPVSNGESIKVPGETRWLLVRAHVIARDLGEGRNFPSETLRRGSIFTRVELPEPALKGEASRSLTIGLESQRSDEHITVILNYDQNPVNFAVRQKSFDLVFDRMVTLAREWTKNVVKQNITWEALFIELGESDDPASYALITELAQQDVSASLQRIYTQPRQILNRIRTQERIHRVREMDIGCLINLCQRPGITIQQKAGEKQRILAIKRQETKDTLENRVAKHCVILIARVAKSYLDDYGHELESERVERVTKLLKVSSRLQRSSALEEVTPLSSPCRTPNYPLLQNIHYHRIWEAYIELVKNFDLKANLWRWARRQWADLHLVTMIQEQTPHIAQWVPVWSRLAQLRREPVFGKWLFDDTAPGPWRSLNGEGTLYLADRMTQSQVLPGIEWLHADYCWIQLNGDSAIVTPVYTFWQHHSKVMIAEEPLNELIQSVSGYLPDHNLKVNSPQFLQPDDSESKRDKNAQYSNFVGME